MIKKNLLIFTLIVTTSLAIQSKDYIKSFNGKHYYSKDIVKWNVRKEKYDINEPFSEKHLVSTVWFIPFNDPVKFSSAIMMFYSDHRFKYGTYQNGAYISGEYTLLSNNTLKLYNIKDEINDPDWRLEDIFYESDEIYFEIDENPYYGYSHSIKTNNNELIFAASNSDASIGTIIDIWGYKATLITKEAEIKIDTVPYLKPIKDINNIYREKFGGLELVINENGKEEHKYIREEAVFKEGTSITIIADSTNLDFYFCLLPVQDEFYRYISAWILKDHVSIKR